jgi:hypothetical protein
MSKALAIVVCAASAAMLGGCTELVRRQATGSLKDDYTVTPARVSAPARPEIIRETIKEPSREPARAETAKPEPAKADNPSVIDKARAEQSARCGQRHIDHGKGTLNETENEKQLADAICVELHRYDHMR